MCSTRLVDESISIVINYAMIALLTLGVAILVAGILVTILLYDFVNYQWLQYTLTALVVSLPFEQIPSLSVGGGTLRISQILTLIASYILVILILKKDARIMSTRLNYFVYITLAFFTLSIPSWFLAVQPRRFLITFIPTVIVFVAALLISHFLDKPLKVLKLLYISLAASALFGVYQFIGDIVGIPQSYTFLSERYTKIVFGFPRIHSTAIEPLYFAGMLFLPIIAFFIYWLSHTDILPTPRLSFVPTSIKNIIIVGFFGIVFTATIAKSAIAVLACVLGLIVCIWILKYPVLKTAQDIMILGLIAIFGIYGLLMFFPTLNTWFVVIYEHALNTLSGQSATFQEREIFLIAAFTLLPFYYLTGIGSGQYGIVGEHMLRFLPEQKDGGYYIVNNAYLEVLLEYGLLPFCLFVGFLVKTMYDGFVYMLKKKDWQDSHTLHIIILTLTLFANCLQWMTFSPIYIMPIFIVFGLLINLLTRDYTHINDLE